MRGRWVWITLALVFLGGCSQSASPPASRPTPEPPRPAPARTPSRADRAPHPTLVRFASGFDTPVGIANAGDGSGDLYVVEQGGRVHVIERAGVTRTFLDVSDRLVSGGEQGLLGLAFHPDYEHNRRLFVNYTDLDGNTVVSEFRAARGAADALSERILLRIDQPFANHNGGQLAFGPDGYLYIGTGDGGSAGDPQNNGQRLDTLLGKILRIDVDRGKPYAIPPDNPFTVDDGARPEIWAYGLRNPWRFSFDRVTGDLWIGDVGQDRYEEIDRAPAGSSGGRNYGWRVMEGRSCFEPGCDRSGLVTPVATYDHAEGCSVTNGFVYRGQASPALRGFLFLGDYCSGRIWMLRATGAGDLRPALDTRLNISTFGEDEDGEIYVADAASGDILRLEERPD